MGQNMTDCCNLLIKFSIACWWLFAATGCATTASQQEIDNVLTHKKGGVVVIGADGKNFSSLGLLNASFAPRVHIITVNDNGIDVSAEFSTWTGWNKESYTASANDGYAVLSLPASKNGESYVVVDYQGNATGAQLRTVCLERRTPSFKVKDGDVIYVGSYVVEVTQRLVNGYSWKTHFTFDFPSAKRNVEKTLPNIAAQLKPAIPEVRIAKGFGASCELSIVSDAK